MIYKILATGSDGNAVIINDTILIDCGVPFKAVKNDLKRLRLVLLTHEHGDHFNASTAARMAQERPTLRWGCCPWMVQKLVDSGVRRSMIDVYTPGKTAVYAAQNLMVCPVELTHNVPNCGYKLRQGPTSDTDSFRGTLFYATDTGTLDGITAKGFDLYMVEANHSRAEIEERAAAKIAAGEYAYEFKAAENHLSIEQAMDWLTENMGQNSVWVPMHQHKEKGGHDREQGISDGTTDQSA